jgi:hypothetical protein
MAPRPGSNSRLVRNNDNDSLNDSEESDGLINGNRNKKKEGVSHVTHRKHVRRHTT